jgi:hypothetical protein
MHIGKKGDILTTVRLQDELFESFKTEAVKNRITNRNLIERSMYLYLTDEDFKKRINNQLNARYTKPTE